MWVLVGLQYTDSPLSVEVGAVQPGDDTHDNCSKAVREGFPRAGDRLSACLPKSQNSALSSHWTAFSLKPSNIPRGKQNFLKADSSCVIHTRIGFSEKSSIFKLIFELKSIKPLNCHALLVQFLSTWQSPSSPSILHFFSRSRRTAMDLVPETSTVNNVLRKQKLY